MPPQLQALLQDKRMLGIVVGALVLLVIGGFVLFGSMGGKHSPGDEPLTKEQMILATVNSEGQALEIQSLLAGKGIRLEPGIPESGKIPLMFMKGATQSQRTLAIVTLVQSGLMDRNVGLEIFEKGDLTASREEKKIKLVRAQQGELARLIRKIDPIQDASVIIKIPEQTLFRSEKTPASVTVQVTVPPGSRLTRDKVRAIINLVVGALPDVDDKHVSLSDTNGNTYNSVLDGGAEINDKLAEQDEYMKQKVSAQLDRLVGAGNYVVTVSTQLREAPREVMVQQYRPDGAVKSTEQSFSENLDTNGGPGAGGPATSFLPNGMGMAPTGGGASGKNYTRSGKEYTFNNSKEQWIETRPVGMTEDVSIAVTIDSSHFPRGYDPAHPEELQVLLAHAASPSVNPEHVTIARSDLNGNVNPLAAADGEKQEGIPWWVWAGGTICVFLIVAWLFSLLGNRNQGNNEEFEQTMQELQELRSIASQQQMQLQATQQQTQMLLEAQQRLQTQPPEMIPAMAEIPAQIPQNSALQQTLDELKEVVAIDDMEDDNLDLQIRSWIESS